MSRFQNEIEWCRLEQRKALQVIDLIDRGNLRVSRDLHDATNEDWTTEYKVTQRELAEKMAKMADAYEALGA